MSDVADLFKELKERISGGSRETRVSFNLLYRVRVNQAVSADEFHRNCDGKGPTLTLLYGKLNTLFGGYTSKNWSSDKKKVKSDYHAFLFYKNDNAEAKCHFLPIKTTAGEKAIMCDSNFGPTFGVGPYLWSGYDMQTFYSDKTRGSESKDGYLHLNGEMDIKHVYGSDATRREEFNYTKFHKYLEAFKQEEEFDVHINGGTLNVKALEVYQVIDDRLQRSWREKPTNAEVKKMKDELERMEPLPGLGLEDYNILLVGIIGAGKSSFFNTLATVFANEVKSHAIVGDDIESITNEVHAYKLTTGKMKQLNLRIFDIRGLEETRGYGAELDCLLEGRIPVGFTFPEQPSTLCQQDLVESRGLKNEIHLVCFVVDATCLDVISDEVLKRISEIKKVIRKKDLPMVAVATKFDVLCPTISEDADHIYNSPKARTYTEAVSARFGIPLKNVFPVVNYTNENKTSNGIDRLAVQALSSMVKLIADYLQHHKGMAVKSDSWTDRIDHLKVMRSEDERSLRTLKLSDLLGDFDDKPLRVLCIGYEHSGKSCFIDAISSLLIQKISHRVSKGFTYEDDAGAPTGSTTERFEMYNMKYKTETDRPSKINMYFGDLPGLQAEGGMTLDHVKKVIRGHVPNNFKIKLGITKDSKRYIQKPRKEDKIHCVCYVFDICSVDKLPQTFVQEFKSFQAWLRATGIPYIVILTKADKLSEAVEENCLQVFTNKTAIENKDKLIKMFNFVESKMFPVVNYVHQSRVVPEMDALLFEVFKEILEVGSEYLEDLVGRGEEEEENED